MSQLPPSTATASSSEEEHSSPCHHDDDDRDNSHHPEREEEHEKNHSDSSSEVSLSSPLFQGMEFVLVKETMKPNDYEYFSRLIPEHGGVLAENVSERTTHLVSERAVWPVPPHVLSVNVWFVEDCVYNEELCDVNAYLWNGEVSLHGQPQLKKRKLENVNAESVSQCKNSTTLEMQLHMDEMARPSEIMSHKWMSDLLLDDIWFEIFMFLEIADLSSVILVSKEMYRLIQDDRYEKNQSFWIQYYNRFIRNWSAQDEHAFFNSIHNTSFDKFDTETNLHANKQRLELTLQKVTLLLNRRACPQLTESDVMPQFSLPALVKNRIMTHLHFSKSLKRRMTARITCEAESKSERRVKQVEKDSKIMTLFPGLSLKDQLEALKSKLNDFTEINFGPFDEYEMNGQLPKDYLDWISQNSDLLSNSRIRSLFFLDVHFSFCEVSWMKLGDLSKVLNTFPKLAHWTSMGSEQLQFSTACSHSTLRSIVLISAGLSKPILKELFCMKLPNLCHLELFLGDDCRRDARQDFKPEFIQELLKSPKHEHSFPSLDYLGLRNYQHIDAIAPSIFENPFSKRVRMIDISLGTLSDEGAKSFIEILKNEEKMNQKFLNLEILDVHNSYLSKEIVEELLNLSTMIVNVKPHKEADRRWRYVTLNE
ncbi:hypothetical protein FDP41_000903 [Naegleria fowleri]|uniref:BRCT domain-containing protein n=1 Tax=Naegleria fowleri TaxID=5763 RepID=A0A6A5C1M1_NAEFO|nr:uncharacterized protein FDP41_000903 [Naegleria fowleri]KAF0979750.1 hypothetical protein FDP41_000903 [Naegleria fowleri]CAG4719475.1 unnamed protein product [Naegleria fowleri]